MWVDFPPQCFGNLYFKLFLRDWEISAAWDLWCSVGRGYKIEVSLVILRNWNREDEWWELLLKTLERAVGRTRYIRSYRVEEHWVRRRWMVTEGNLQKGRSGERRWECVSAMWPMRRRSISIFFRWLFIR